MTRQRQRKRQGYGEGSVYRRKDGIWIATIEAGTTVNDTRRRIQVSAKDEETVRRKLRDKRRALDRSGVTEVSARATIKSWTEEWLPIVERKLRPAAYNASRSGVTRWIIPTIGHVRFDALQPAHIRAVANAQRDAGRSSSTQLRTHSVLMSLLKAALIEGYPVTDRVLAVPAPAAAVSDRQAMSVDEALAVLEQASLQPDASRWVAALLQGMRQAEALGLTWSQVDLDAGELHVAWQLKPLSYRIPRDRTSGFRIPDGYEVRQLRGALHLVRPKSKAGHRVNPLVPWMTSSLEQWRELAPTSPHDLVWPRADGEPQTSKEDDAAWYALQAAADVHHPAGRPYTIHECRHTTATLLIEGGVDRATVAAIIGQSKLVESYVHLGRSPVVRQALEGVADRLGLSVIGADRQRHPQADGSRPVKVTAKVTRSGNWWAIEVPEVPGTFSQAKRLEQAEAMAAEATALMLDVPVEEIEVEVDIQLRESLSELVAASEAAAAQAREAQEFSSSMLRTAVMLLRNDGLSLRDCAAVLGVSFQRVSQLEQDAPNIHIAGVIGIAGLGAKSTTPAAKQPAGGRAKKVASKGGSSKASKKAAAPRPRRRRPLVRVDTRPRRCRLRSRRGDAAPLTASIGRPSRR